MQTISIDSQYIWMEFGIENCVMVIRKRRKRWTLQSQESIRTLEEKENYKHLGILEAESIKQRKDEGEKKKRVVPKNQKASQSKLYSRNLIRVMNTWVVLVRYTGSLLKCDKGGTKTNRIKGQERAWLHAWFVGCVLWSFNLLYSHIIHIHLHAE